MRLLTLSFLLLFAQYVDARTTPKLLVVVVVDQMRGDCLTNFAPQFKKGFKKLMDEGAWYTNAHHTHVPTATAPGHAAIATGQLPEKTGIVGNTWYNMQIGKRVYAVTDENKGAGPYMLEAPTFGDALKKKNNLSKVVAISFKDRSAILLGGKKADMALWFDSSKKHFTTSSFYGESPLWLEAFNEKIKVNTTALADKMTFKLAQKAFDVYDLGKDDNPDVLLIGFSALDSIGHRAGPGSTEVNRQLAILDEIIGDLISFLETRLGHEAFDLVLTSDHGVLPTPEKPSGVKINAKRITFKNLEESVETALQTIQPRADKWVAEVIFPSIYLYPTHAKKQSAPWKDFIGKAVQELQKLDGIESVFSPIQINKADPYFDIYQHSYYAGRSGDLILRPRYGVLITKHSYATDHGTPYAYDTHVPLIFWGNAFKTQKFDAHTAVINIAPTCAELLDVPFSRNEYSRILKEAFN